MVKNLERSAYDWRNEQSSSWYCGYEYGHHHGQDDTAVGHAALNALTSASDDTAVGNDALVSVTTGDYNTAVGSTAGEDITTGLGNTAIGKQALQMVTTANDNTAIGHNAGLHITTSANTAVGKDSQNYNATGQYNTSLGQDAMWGGTGPGCSTGGTNYSGSYNTAVGQGSFCNVSSGNNNTLVGWESGVGMTTGSNNVIVGYLAGTTSNSSSENVAGSNNTWVGYQAGPGTSTQLTNSSAIGANALVSQSNSLVLGGTGTHAVNVGIGTTTPSNILTIAQNAGDAIADGWNTYSSRRWKTNISTLHNALNKIQQLRGVSYDLKAGGKHELGVVAEEVGAIVPEIVSWNPSSGEADGVDYGRLSALLIEATKEQQRLIKKQQSLLAEQQKQIQVQEEQIAHLTSQVKQIESALAANQRTGFGSEDTTSIQATGRMQAGQTTVTNLTSPTGCQLGKSEYWYYCLPEGMNITIAGAGPAGSPLHARILNIAGNNTNGMALDTIVLDTPATTSVTAANITYQVLTVTPIAVAH